MQKWVSRDRDIKLRHVFTEVLQHLQEEVDVLEKLGSGGTQIAQTPRMLQRLLHAPFQQH